VKQFTEVAPPSVLASFGVAAPSLRRWADGFTLAKQSQNLSPRTITIYRDNLSRFVAYCEARNITAIEAIDPTLLREYMLSLAEHHNAGGQHQHYRVIKTFFLWWGDEAAPEGWKNPIRKVPAPKLPDKIMPPVEMADVTAMLDTCGGDYFGVRDKAMMLTLIDTGLRANELLSLDVADFDSVTGALTVKQGKGGKGRVVFAGQRTRKVIRAWLKERGNSGGAMFPAKHGARLNYRALRAVIERRARDAGLTDAPELHAFRRGFALAMLRDGCDIVTLSRLMGHSDLSLIRRYTKQTSDDLREAAERHSPADRL